MLIWLVSAVTLGTLVAAARLLRTDGDDADPGRQRPGILDLAELPEPAPTVAGIDLSAGRPTVVFFVARRRLEELCAALRDDENLARERVVIAAPSTVRLCARNATVVSTDVERAARAFGLPDPRGDVAPTGYAIVDSGGRIRYRTLDPVAPSLLDEAATMLRGVR